MKAFEVEKGFLQCFRGSCSIHFELLVEADPLLTDDNLLDDFVTFFVAGQETTANALSFLLCEVGQRPDVMQR